MGDMLTQEEIDALLRGSVFGEEKNTLSPEEADALSEILTLSVNVVRSFMLAKIKRKVSFLISDLSKADYAADEDFLKNDLFALEAEFTEGIIGKIYFILKMEDVKVINDLLIGGDGANLNGLDSERLNTDILLEAVKEVFPEAVSSLATVVKRKIESQPPAVFAISENRENLKQLYGEKLVRVIFKFDIGNVISSKFIVLIPLEIGRNLVKMLLDTVETIAPPDKEPDSDEPVSERNRGQISVQPVNFPIFDGESKKKPPQDESIDFILDVPLQISVELGRTRKTIKEILDLNIGSIIELNKLADDFVDVLVNGKLIARGEVIVVDENFGIRVTELYTNKSKISENLK